MDVREKLVELANDVLRYLPWGEIQKDTAERIADRMMDHGVTVQEWIPVTERLPEKGGAYLVFSSKSKTVFTAHYWLGDRWANRANGQFITHWMEMPMPPKEKNNA